MCRSRKHVWSTANRFSPRLESVAIPLATLEAKSTFANDMLFDADVLHMCLHSVEHETSNKVPLLKARRNLDVVSRWAGAKTWKALRV